MNKFLRCKHCGNFITFIKDAGVSLECCGEKMTELIPNSSEGAADKHTPEVSVTGDTVTVKVGHAPHAMEDKHYVEFVYLNTTGGGQVKILKPGEEPEAVFNAAQDTPLEVYEYCNLHGLWTAKV